MAFSSLFASAHKHNVKVDWISTLPDDLLICILSFLSTKEAVQTCILSKRWRRVWADLPVLKFNITEFGVGDSIGGSDEALRESITKFDQFVSGVVQNREPTHLNRVSYVHDGKRTKFYKVPMRWLDQVALLMPKLIDISIFRVTSLDLPDSIFSCATLQHLNLKLHAVNTPSVMPASIFLPSLKVFDISHVELPDDFAQNLLMGCPSLETLKLYFCLLHFNNISSNMLKELDIVGCHPFEPMQISCPRLFSLRSTLYCRGGTGLSMKNMKSLKSADIGLSSLLQHFAGGHLPVLNFFGDLSNATHLILYIYRSEIKVQVDRDFRNCRNFNNLKELSICMCNMSFDFNLLASLLMYSPNVEKLSLILEMTRVVQEEHQQEVSGDVLFQHKFIETIKIRDVSWRKLPEVLIETLTKTLNTYVKEIGSVIIE